MVVGKKKNDEGQFGVVVMLGWLQSQEGDGVGGVEGRS